MNSLSGYGHEITATKQSKITGIIGGQIVSLSDTPLLTSASTPWSGFLLEEVRGDLVRNEVSWGWHRTHVCLVTRGCIRFTLKVGGRQEHVIVRQGDINVFPNGFGKSRFIYDGSNFQAICVEVDPERINILNQSLPYTALKPQIAVPNAEIAAVLTNMKTEVARGCPSGDLYAQALSLALVAYLESHFAISPRQSKIPGRFSPSEVQLLTDYIRANLDRGLSLCQLANLVGMSSKQFIAHFRAHVRCFATPICFGSAHETCNGATDERKSHSGNSPGARVYPELFCLCFPEGIRHLSKPVPLGAFHSTCRPQFSIRQV